MDFAGYAVATFIGVLRVYNNRHCVPDVAAGSALGFLCTGVAYAINSWIKAHIFHSHYDYTADY
ncbi:phosphatase PAP2 family protein [Arachidicoccus ginsenosidivorans]|uniref:phosphatase PAP2 family protein n=1 Tax=Arachidicoccus ginsenosidivorans TaxID=496057 RepID=UPI0037430CB6